MSKKVVYNEEALASVKALNELAIANSEKLVALNVAQLQKQADVALSAWRSMLDVKDLSDVQGYMASQSEVARELLNGIVADSKTVAKLGEETAAEIGKLVNANIEAIKRAA